MLPIGAEVRLPNVSQKMYRIKPRGTVVSFNKKYKTYRIRCTLSKSGISNVLYFTSREIDILNPSPYTDDLDNWV